VSLNLVAAMKVPAASRSRFGLRLHRVSANIFPVERLFEVGDMVRVTRIPPYIADHPPEVLRAFEFALGNTYRVEIVDWGGWVWLELNQEHGGIGVEPDCVELVG
jgi:hypothetical protein